MGTVAVLLLLVLLLQFSPESGPLLKARMMRGSLILGVLLIYAGVVLGALMRWRRRAISSPLWFRYLNTLVEVSIPTAALLLLASVMGLAPALAGAAPYLYFVLIAFTALYLDARLCAVAGFTAMIQFSILSWLGLQGQASVEGWEILTSPAAQGFKAATLVLAGLAAGFVAHQIRRQMIAAVRSASERDRAVSIFGQHVSPQVADMLLSQPVELSGEEREVCVMFLDIRDFSKLAAAQAPGEVMQYLNTLFTALIDIINRHQGIVNKFLGDGFMAVFGAPVNDGSLCEHAVMAAKEILSTVAAMNRDGSIPETRVGMGLHVGDAVTGNVGSEERKEYTIIGDVVNLAARIEQATKQFQAQLIVSEAVWQRLAKDGHPVTDLGEVELKGQPKPTQLFKLA
jgi:adenylate cyclase